MSISEYEKGFIEALIDSEGCLTVGFDKQKTSSNFRIRCLLEITNINLEILQKAQKIIGGNILHKKLNPPRKDVYVLHVGHNNLRKYLPLLDLIVKRRQKEIVLEVLKNLDGPYGFEAAGRGRKRPEWKEGLFKKFKLEMHQLNQRGKNCTQKMI